MELERSQVDRWLQAYVAAWKSYDREEIAALFAEDVEYRYHPYDKPVRGREAVVASWLREPDAPGTYHAKYGCVAVDGDVAVATGSSVYRSEPGGPVARVYDNCFVMRFDASGGCRELTEWYAQRPRSPEPFADGE